MKHLVSTLWLLSALVLVCGCGGGGKTLNPASGPSPQGLNIAGNWQFNMTSMTGMTPGTIAGSIAQSGSAISGAVHVEGSNCFNRLTAMGLTATLTGSKISLTSTSVGGQVTTFSGSITDTAFTGTYTINGGCADGDQGNVTGIKIPTIPNIFSGTFTTSGGETFDVAANVAQYSTPSTEGSFGMSGTVTFLTSCFGSGTITPGTFPSGSFIMGTSVALEIETNNGTVAFHGTASQATGDITGDYTVLSSTCDQTGKAVLVASSPWDY